MIHARPLQEQNQAVGSRAGSDSASFVSIAETIEALRIRELDLAQAMSSRVVADAERSRLAAAVEQAAEGVFLLALDKTITYANPAARELYGFEARDLIATRTSSGPTCGRG